MGWDYREVTAQPDANIYFPKRALPHPHPEIKHTASGTLRDAIVHA